MKVDFYYWSYQCPLNNSMMKLLKEYEDKLHINYHDISENFELAQRMNMFFPTLTVVNDTYRFFSPIRRSFLNSLYKGEIPIEKPYLPKLGRVAKEYTIKPITKEICCIACSCTGEDNLEDCNKKLQFYENQKLSVFGYINIDSNNKLLGGVEYLPSLMVPYKIPKDSETVFLTCVYLSDSDYDYKSGPLRALENHLNSHFNKVFVISDEIGVFPNGDLKFFLENGYEDLGVISKEKDYCTLHLMCKNLD
ncbi:MAG: hypothetical protein RR844_02155 [Clostridium sp.]